MTTVKKGNPNHDAKGEFAASAGHSLKGTLPGSDQEKRRIAEHDQFHEKLGHDLVKALNQETLEHGHDHQPDLTAVDPAHLAHTLANDNSE